MIAIKFPADFTYYWKAPGVKAAFVSEVKPTHPHDCKNCGGIGTMSTFCASQGPFDSPPAGASIVAHFANGKWWGGAHFSGKCPVCEGLGRDPNYKESPIRVNPIKAKEALAALGKMDTGQTEYLEDMELTA